jgi:DNA invertase Pin-like site-specific DNA recombinase
MRDRRLINNRHRRRVLDRNRGRPRAIQLSAAIDVGVGARLGPSSANRSWSVWQPAIGSINTTTIKTRIHSSQPQRSSATQTGKSSQLSRLRDGGLFSCGGFDTLKVAAAGFDPMANSLVVRKGTSLAKRDLALRAAQYVRMSTDYQRYSIENQAAVIATYARLHGLTIVETYRDAGLSGVRLKNRTGLIRLLDDVQSGLADFGYILVYDVSRWGRFQDTDEAAHYEFICKKAGIQVAYCAEQFDNDGTMLSSIVKNLKRVMAAEFSRELSTKVHTGLLRVASLGFRVGAPLGYGLRRELLDENGASKGLLKRGEQKNLKTDRVILRLGPANEVRIINRIFAEYVERKRSQEEIVRQLNQEGVPNHLDRPWTRRMIDYVLSDERYMGNIIYNRESYPLRERKIKNPPELWLKHSRAIEPAVSEGIFLKARRRLTLRWQRLDDDQLLSRLKALLAKEGRLSESLINNTLGIPAINVFCDRFGSLRNAYRRIGYEVDWDFDWIDRKNEFNQLLSDTAGHIVAVLKGAGLVARYEPGIDQLTIEDRAVVSLRLARPWQTPTRKTMWTISRRKVLREGYIAAIRLAADRVHVLDYLLVPTSEMTGRRIRFTEARLDRFDGRRVATLDYLAAMISRQCKLERPRRNLRSGNASQAMRPRQKRPRAKRSPID